MQELSQGNTYHLTFRVLNKDGSEKDLSGTQELRYAISKRKNTKPLIEFSLGGSEISYSGSDVTIKIVNPVLNSLLEGSYHHEIWQVNALGDPTTLLSEKLSITSKLIKE